MKNPYPLARGLGWFSIGLGASELLFGRALARWLGSPKSEDLLRFYGARELAAGIGILSQKKPSAGWLWSRVAGDAMDIATLALTAKQPRANETNVGIALAAVLGATALDVVCALELSAQEKQTDGPAVRKSITIGRSAQELYDFYRDPANLAQIMGHFAKVTPSGRGRTHWEVKGPLGEAVTWDAAQEEDPENYLLSWQTLPGASVPNRGSVHFTEAPAGRGTEVALVMDFRLPGGAIGKAAAQLIGVVPATLSQRALRRFKALVETGELPTLEHNSTTRTGASANAF